MSTYRRITYEDRFRIYALSKREPSQESIAELLGISQSAEAGRCIAIVVSAAIGSRRLARKAIRRKPRKLTALMRSKIETKLRRCAGRWSRSAAG
jgi:IS30 family transposase